MVGVPLSRGCQACRGQKKRCQGDSAPCVRCQRLRIPCIGLGQQRFKFHDENARFETAAGSRRPSPKASIREAIDDSGSALVTSRSASANPSPRLTINVPFSKTLSLAVRWGSEVRPLPSERRTNLPWELSPLLDAIPSRLGQSEVLDISVEALISAHGIWRLRRYSGGFIDDARKQQPLQNYCRALSVLRKCLRDDTKAASEETLASTLILMMVEVLSTRDDDRVLSHAGGAGQILKARGGRSPRSEFERRVLSFMRGPVILRALFFKLDFTRGEWNDLVVTPIDDSSVSGQMLRTLAQIPTLFHGLRTALARSTLDHMELAWYQATLSALGSKFKPIRSEIIDRYSVFASKHPHDGFMTNETSLLHGDLTRDAGIAYATDILILVMRSAVEMPVCFDPIDRFAGPFDQYLIQASACAEAISRLADEVKRHRPIGTAYLTFVLQMSQAATLDASVRSRLDAQLFEYDVNMYGGEIYGGEASQARPCVEELRRFLLLQDVRSLDEPGVTSSFVESDGDVQ